MLQLHMMKVGRFRAIRNIPVGWVLQAIHSTDQSERIFRVLFEAVAMFLAFVLVSDMSSFVLFAVLIHTLMFILNGNFLVYMLDSFEFIENGGIHRVLKYVTSCKKWFIYFDSCDAILIYGSMCRGEFHIRSDLDLRVIRRRDSMRGLWALPIGFLMRAYSLLVRVPTDLAVVDSLGFLTNTLRPDEKPIVVFVREGVKIDHGWLFDDIISDTELVLKKPTIELYQQLLKNEKPQ